MVSREEETLRKIVSKVLLLDESNIGDDLSRNDLEAWDSLAHLMLISEVESSFQVTLSDDDIVAINTVGDLKRILRKLGVSV